MLRRYLAQLLALVLLLSACTSGEEPPPASGDGPTGGPTTQPEPEPEPERERLLPEEGDFVALPRDRHVLMWEEPGKGKQGDFALDTRNPTGANAPLLIEGATRRDGEAWYEVLLPLRPNGATAWLRARDVRVREREDRLEVDLSKRTLTHYRNGEKVDRFLVGVGTEQYPTGTGRFYIWFKLPYANPNNVYGIMVLGLSGFSPVLSDWPGEGRMAVHGTPVASNRGQRVSHGCVRVYNQDMRSLVDLPLGTPVVISE